MKLRWTKIIQLDIRRSLTDNRIVRCSLNFKGSVQCPAKTTAGAVSIANISEKRPGLKFKYLLSGTRQRPLFFFIVHTFAAAISVRKEVLKSLTVFQICRFNLTPKIGPLNLIQNRLQSSQKFFKTCIEHPKIKFYPFFTYFNNKIGSNTSLSMFLTSSKSQNWVKISNALTILGITRKVIIIEERTKNLKN